MSGEGTSQQDIQIYEYQLEHARSIVIPYNLRSGVFYRWLNLFEYAANLVGIPDLKMVEFLMIMLDDNIFTTENIPTRAELSCLTYEDLIQKLHRLFSKHYKYSNLHRIRFLDRYQFSSETIEQFADNLEKLFNMSGYPGPRKTALRRQFVKGVRSAKVKNKLKNIRYMNYNKFLKIAFEQEGQDNT